MCSLTAIAESKNVLYKSRTTVECRVIGVSINMLAESPLLPDLADATFVDICGT